MDEMITKFCCPHCGQHLSVDVPSQGEPITCPTCGQGFNAPGSSELATPGERRMPSKPLQFSFERHFRCPRCGSDLGAIGLSDQTAACGRCGWSRRRADVTRSGPGMKPYQPWVTGIGLLIAGAVSPLIVLLGMSLAFVTGPLVFLAGPALGIVVARVLCGFIYDREGPRWFWYYLGAGVAVWLLWVGSTLWGRHPAGNPDNEWGGFALMTGTLIAVAAVFFWLIGAAWTWFAAQSQD